MSFESAAQYLPSVVFVQISRRCNLTCAMCGWKVWQRNKGVMSEKVFDRVLEEVKKCGIKQLAFTGAQGEPLLNPKAGEYITKALSAGLTVEINTNCTTLGNRNVKMLAEAYASGRLVIQASFSGYDKVSHESVYVGSDFEDTSRKLKNLHDVIAPQGSPEYFKINGVILDGTPPAKHYAYLASIGIDPGFARFHGADNFAGIVPNGRSIVGRQMHLCHVLVKYLIVYDDGKVSACACRDSEGVMEIGDINTEGFMRMRTEPRFMSMLAAFDNKDLSGQALCSKCDIPYYGTE